MVFLFATISGPAAYRERIERKRTATTDRPCLLLESSTLRNERGWLIAMMGARLQNRADAPKEGRGATFRHTATLLHFPPSHHRRHYCHLSRWLELVQSLV